MDLSVFPLGQDARIVGLDLEPDLALRLGELGLRTGTIVRVVHHGSIGRVVALGSDRLALDMSACRAVKLAPAL